MPLKKLDQIKQQLRRVITPKPPLTNLVFKGGGVRGIAYLGALQVLDQYGLLKDLKRVGGTSAGSLTALMLSMHMDTAEIAQTLAQIHFPDLLQELDDEEHHGIVKNLLQDTACVMRFRNRFGWYANHKIHNLLEQLVARGCNGNGRATFADFWEMGHRNIYIIASNISRYRRELFSYETTPQVAVADAALMSSSIPIFFEPVRFDGKLIGSGDYYVDGGIYDNYPIHVFDRPEYAMHGRNYRSGINYETLGFFLYPPKYKDDSVHMPVKWNEFIELIFSNLYISYQVQPIMTSEVDIHRTVLINDCGIKATDFHITADSDKYRMLLESGRNATRAFLEAHEYIEPDDEHQLGGDF